MRFLKRSSAAAARGVSRGLGASSASQANRGGHQSPLARAIATACEHLEKRTMLTTVTWTAATSGRWLDPSNWSTHQLPQSGDDVVIQQPGNITITVDGAATANSVKVFGDKLELSAGSLTLAANSNLNASSTLMLDGGSLAVASGATVSVDGAGTWSSGGLVGPGGLKIDLGASLTLSSAATKTLDGAAIVTNAGTINNNGVGDISLSGGSVFDNAAALNWSGTSTFTAGDNNPEQVTNEATGTIVNTGSLTTGAGITFSNLGGSLDTEGGQIAFAGLSTLQGGTYVANQSGFIDLTDGQSSGSNVSTITGTLVGTGDGTITLDGGTLLVGAAGATINFSPGLFQWSGGTISVSSTLTNAGVVSVDGTSGPIQLTLPAGTSMTNSGTVIEQGSTPLSVVTGGLTSAAATITNNAGATWQFVDDTALLGQFSTLFVNKGLITKTGGTGTGGFALLNTNTSSIFFDNNGGTLWAQSGTLDLLAGTVGTTFEGGTYNASTGAELLIDEQVIATGTLTGSGGGNFVVTGTLIPKSGTLVLNFPKGYAKFTRFEVGLGDNFSYGNILNQGYLTFDSGTATNSFSAIEGAGTFTNAGTIDQIGTGTFVMFTFNSTNLGPTLFINDANAVWNIDSDSSIGQLFIGGINTFTYSSPEILNYGSIIKQGGTGTSILNEYVITDSGLIEARSGTLQISADSFSQQNGGVLQADTGVKLVLTGGLHGLFSPSGLGTISVTSEYLRGDSTLNIPAAMNPIIKDGFVLNGFTLTNAGSATWVVDAASSPPDFGSLDGPGNFLNAAGATLTFQGTGSLFETTGPVTFDNQGTVTLAGNIYYGPDPSDSNAQTDGTIKNEGTIVRASGSGTSELFYALTNTGTIESDSGTLKIDSLTQLDASGTWKAMNGSTIAVITPSTITDNTATLYLNGAGASLSSLTNDLDTNDGTISLSNGVTLERTTLTNNGTIQIDSGAVLQVDQDFQNSSGGLVDYLISGNPDSGSFGQTRVFGNFNNDGTIGVDTADGYAGNQGDQYTLGGANGSFNVGALKSFDPSLSINQNGSSIQAQFDSTGADLGVDYFNIFGDSTNVGDTFPEIVYIVSNRGGVPTNGTTWHDSVYLSTTPTLTSAAILLGGFTQTSGLDASGGANSNYQNGFNPTVPAVLPGTYYAIVVVDDGRKIPDTDRTNNISISNPISIGIHSILPGQTTTVGVAAGTDAYLRFDDPSQIDTLLQFASNSDGAFTVYVSKGTLPLPGSTSNYDTNSQTGSTASIPLINATTGPYFVRIHGNANASFGTNVTITTGLIGFTISSVAPPLVSNAGLTSLTITGYHFTSATAASLVIGAAKIAATNVTFVNSTQIIATFNLAGAAPGAYDLRLTDSGQVATASKAVTVSPNQIRITGTIGTNQHWTAGTVYHLSGFLNIAAGVTITVDPGAIIKSDGDVTIQVNAGAALNVNGTLANPVIFTSIKDSAHGGDTNGDGGAAQPQAGDWGGIYIFGTASINYAQILYAGSGAHNGANTAAALITFSGTTTINNSLIAHSFFDGLYGNGGTLTANNSIITDVDRGVTGRGGTVTLNNVTIYDVVEGLVGHGETLIANNTLIINFSADGVFDFGSAPTLNHSDVFTSISGAVKYLSTPDQTNVRGNISADPKFKNPSQGDFRLNFLAPAIDAGDGSTAPATDEAGNARYNDPRTITKTGIADGNGKYPDMGALEFVESAASTVDLVVSTVSGSQNLFPLAQATITWTDTNNGSGTITGSWTDTIQLINPTAPGGPITIDASTFAASGTLGPGQSKTFTTTVTVPYGADGTYYWQVKTNSAGDVFEGNNSGNNTTVATTPSTLSIPQLADGTTYFGVSFGTVGQPTLYKVITAQGQNLLITLTRPDNGVTDIYLGVGSAPTQTSFLQHIAAYSNGQSQLEITNPGSTTFYLLLIPRTLPSGPTSYTLSASAVVFALTSIGVTTGSSGGTVTVPLSGAGFVAGMTATLKGPSGATFSASSVTVTDSAHAYATFALTAAPLGNYDVTVSSGANTTTLPAAFSVTPKSTSGLQVTVTLPNAIRVGRLFQTLITYTNLGKSDIAAPLLHITSPTGNLMSLTATGTLTGELTLVAASQDGPAGILRAGASYTVVVYVLGLDNFNQIAAAYSVPSAAAFDWNGLESTIRPATATPAWDAAFTRAVAAAGPSNADYLNFISSITTSETQRTGAVVYNPNSLLGQYISYQADIAGADLIGTVYLNDTSTPLGNVEALATNTSTGQVYSAISNADGTVYFPFVPAGTYLITAPGYLADAVQLPISVSGTNASRGNYVVDKGADIVGRVVAPGVDLSRDSVIATDSSNNNFVAVLTSTGSYDLSGLPASSYSVSFTGDAAIALPNGINNIAVGTGQVVRLADIIASTGAVYQGRVVDAGTQNGIDGAIIQLTSTTGQVFYGTADASGNFSIPEIIGGKYNLVVRSSGYAAYKQSALILTPGDAATTQNISLSTGATISGTVTFNGAPSINTPVSIYQNGTLYEQMLTDSSGNYQLIDLPAGAVTLVATPEQQDDSTQNLTLVAGQSSTINIALVSSGTVSGQLTIHGAPVTDMPIVLIGPGDLLYYGSTDSAGRYTIGGLPGGNYTVMLSDGSIRHAVTVLGNGDVETVNFAPDLGAIGGVVLNSDASPDGHALVLLLSNGQLVSRVYVGNDGTYQFIALRPGTYQIEVQDGAQTFSAQSVVVPANSTSRVTVPASIPGTSTIAVSLADLGNNAISVSTFVTITPLDFDPSQVQPLFNTAPAFNDITFSNLAPGRYLISAASSVGIANQIVTIAAGSNNVTLHLAAATTIAGIVTAPNGTTPLPGVIVTAYPVGMPDAQVTTQTDSTGGYKLAGLAPGSYVLVFIDGNLNYRSITITNVTAGSNATVTESISLGANSVHVTGSITESGGTSAPSFGEIAALNSDGVIAGFGQIQPDGTYEIDDLAPGSYTLVGITDGYSFTHVPLTISISQTNITQNLNATWEVAAAETPTFTNGANAPLMSALGLSPFAKNDAVPQDSLLDRAQAFLGGVLSIIGLEPRRAPGLAPFIPPACDCTDAEMAFNEYINAQGFDSIASTQFSAWHDAWWAATETLPADTGLFGVNLLQFAGGLFSSAKAVAVTGAQAVGKAAGSFASNFKGGIDNMKEAIAAGEIAVEDAQAIMRNVVAYETKLKDLFFADQLGSIAQNTASATFAYQGTGIADNASGHVGFFAQFQSDFLSFADAPTVQGFLTSLSDILTIKSLAVGIVQIGQSLQGLAGFKTFGSKLIGDLGTALNALQTLSSAAQGAYDASQQIRDYLNNHTRYLDFIAKRDYHKQLSDFYAEQAKQDCLDPLPVLLPVPPPIPFHQLPPPPPRPGTKSTDPNAKFSTGAGTAGYVHAGTPIVYTVEFENEATASAAAQEVVVTDQLSSKLDWSTFQFTTISFNGVTINVPAGLQQYSFVTHVSTDANPVSVTAAFDPATGIITWTIESIDPVTGQLVSDPLAGFLPPNDAQHQGEGTLTYSVAPLKTLTDGTVINNIASVVFDVNAPIVTPTTTNTIDNNPPTASVAALPPSETSTSFTVSWSGSDGTGGSGIFSYDLYVSDNGGDFVPFVQDLANTSVMFAGQDGHTYAFYVIATDAAGNVQQIPASAQASTTVHASSVATTFGNLTAPFTAIYGAASATFGGTISQGSAHPAAGEHVIVTLNGVSMSATIDAAGTFSATFDTSSLNASNTAYKVSYSYAGDGTFAAISDAVSSTLTVSKAALTITADSTYKIYGSNDPTFTVSYNGFVNHEGAGALGGTLSFFTNEPLQGLAQVSTLYAINAQGLTSSNYAITFVAGTLRITPAQLLVGGQFTRAYGQANPVFTPSYDGFQGTDNASVLTSIPVLTSDTTNLSTPGQYQLTLTGGSAANYVISSGIARLTIQKAVPILRVDPPVGALVYDGTGDVLSWVHVQVFGAGNGALDPTGAISIAYYAGTNVFVAPLSSPPTEPGTYTVVATQIGDANYIGMTSNPTTFTIVRQTAPLTASVKIDDGSAQRSMIRSISITFSSAVTLAANAITLTDANGNAVAFTRSSSDQTTFKLTFAGTGGSLADGRYTVTVHAGLVNVASGPKLNFDVSQTFWRLFGDFYGTGTVTNADKTLYSQAYRGQSPNTIPYADFDGNGSLNQADTTAFSSELGKTVVSPAQNLNVITGTSGNDTITLTLDADHQHIDWSTGFTNGKLSITDPAGLTINGNGGTDLIALNYANGSPLPTLIHLNGTFVLDGLSGANPLAGTTVDINRSTVYITYNNVDPLATIQGYLKNGYNNGQWTGTAAAGAGVITSQAAQQDSTHATGIGYVDSSRGLIPGMPADTLELKYTLNGDTGLAGSVGFTDFMRLTQNFGTAQYGSWATGDFNYDGKVDASDFAMLSNNYGKSSLPPAPAQSPVVAPTPTVKPTRPTIVATPVAATPVAPAIPAAAAVVSSKPVVSTKAVTPAPVKPKVTAKTVAGKVVNKIAELISAAPKPTKPKAAAKSKKK